MAGISSSLIRGVFFSRAIIKGQKWANEHPEEDRKVTEDWIKVPVNYDVSACLDDSAPRSS